MKAKITTRSVEGLKPGDILWDTDIKGFGVRCQQAARVYVLKTTVNGRQRFYTIGRHGSPWTVEKARREATRLLGVIAGGDDPSAGKVSPERLSEAIEEFFEDHEGNISEATRAAYRRQIDKHIVPRLGTLRIGAVTVDDVAKIHAAMRDKPYQANRVFALLRMFFRWCESPRRRYRPRGSNPCDTGDIQLYREFERHRDLSPEELRRVGAAMIAFEHDKPYAIAALRLLIFTACRREEILVLKHEYVRLDQCQLRLPVTKTGYKIVHLSEAAIEVLKKIPRMQDNPYVIVGKERGQHFVGLRKVWLEVLKKAEIEPIEGQDGTQQQMRIHDIRHHFASTAISKSGASLKMVGRLLGHKSLRSADRYAQLVREVSNAFSDEVGAHIARGLSDGGK